MVPRFMPDQLTKNFTLAELIQSDTATRLGLPNIPDPVALSNLRAITAPGLQRIRDLLGQPLLVSSGYRSPPVNKAIGGSATSQHCTGSAIDFRAPAFGTPLEVCRFIVANKTIIGFDQLIWEGTWVHVSFVKTGARGQVLTARFTGGRASYTAGLPAR